MARVKPVVGVERLLAFGDAVFAIAITLLALDIHVPEGLSEPRFDDALRHVLPDVGSYVLTFVVIGLLWLAHHSVFRLIAGLDGWLLRCDFAFLAVIAALPFPSRLLSSYGSTAAATSIYAGSIALGSALLAAISIRLLIRPELRVEGVSRERIEVVMQRGLVIAVVFSLSIPLSLVSPTAAKFLWLVVAPVRRRLDRDEERPFRFRRSAR